MLIGKHFCVEVSENGWMSGKTVNERIGCNPYLNSLAGWCFWYAKNFPSWYAPEISLTLEKFVNRTPNCQTFTFLVFFCALSARFSRYSWALLRHDARISQQIVWKVSPPSRESSSNARRISGWGLSNGISGFFFFYGSCVTDMIH